MFAAFLPTRWSSVLRARSSRDAARPHADLAVPPELESCRNWWRNGFSVERLAWLCLAERALLQKVTPDVARRRDQAIELRPRHLAAAP